MTATAYPTRRPGASARRALAAARARAAALPRWWPVAALALLALAVAAAVLIPRFAASDGRRVPARRAAQQAAPPSPPPVVEEQRLLEVPPETARIINAERPIVAGPLPAARAFRFTGPAESRERAVDCLAAAGWYEIGDDAAGQRAVMQVVLNRARHPAFPQSVCGVVFQGSERVTGCQFTFTCDGSLLRRRPPAAAWVRAQALAHAALGGSVDAAVGYATHYHADYVLPYWASSLDKIAGLGPHVFYRWRGYWGTRAAFARAPATEEPRVGALASLSAVHAGDGAAPALFPDGLPVDAAEAVAETPAALPPPVAVEGVREKSLRGALVREAKADANQFFLQLQPDTFPGNYATAAVALCKGKPVCLVMGWRDPARMGRSVPLSAGERDALSFQFTRTGEGMDRALWNCRDIPRSNKAQCLPGTAAPATSAAVPTDRRPVVMLDPPPRA